MRRFLSLLFAALVACTAATPRSQPSHTPPSSPRSRPTSPHRSPAASARAHLPFAVERAAGAVVGDTGFMLGGLIPGDRSIDHILSVDLATGRGRLVGSLPAALHDAAATSLGGRVYLFGGSGSAGTLVQRFDPASNHVSTVGHLPRALSDLSAVTIADTMFVLGGFDGQQARREVLATTDGRAFRVVALLPDGLRYTAAAVVGEKVLVVGGQTMTSLASRAVLLIDPTSGSVRRLASLPVPVAHAVVIVRGQTAFAAGGRDDGGRPLRDVWKIDLIGGKVSAAARLPYPIADPTLLVGNSIVLLAGGASGLLAQGGETNDELVFTET
jgi:hypothetical protein